MSRSLGEAGLSGGLDTHRPRPATCDRAACADERKGAVPSKAVRRRVKLPSCGDFTDRVPYLSRQLLPPRWNGGRIEAYQV
jgi:hypothetical protein